MWNKEHNGEKREVFFFFIIYLFFYYYFFFNGSFHWYRLIIFQENKTMLVTLRCL